MRPPAPRKGILAALWIPTDARGRLLKRALAAHIGWLRKSEVHGILALGSTGEFPRMSLAQREEVLAAVIELAGPLPVLANISSIRLDEVIALGRAARRLGAAGVTVMSPHFFPVSQADMLEFFLRAADKVDLPFYLYNFPELTSNRIGIKTIASFADRAPLVGIKQSGGEFDYHTELIKLGRKKKFSVFSGADMRLPEVFGLGAAGCIGGLVNFVPEYMLEIFRICHEGAPGEVSIPAERIKEVGRIIDQLTFPLNVSCGVAARGFDPGAPKTVVSKESARKAVKIEAEFRRYFKSLRLV